MSERATPQPNELPSGAPGACPKCGHKRDQNAAACPRCGLVFAKWDPGQAPRATALDSEGEVLWRQVEAGWSDGALHESFIKHCLQRDLLPAAGRCYRERLDRTPGDAMATRMQAEILSKATLTLEIAHQQRMPAEPFTRSKWFWLVVLTAMALGIVAGLLWRRF